MNYALIIGNNGTQDLEVSVVGYEDSELLHNQLKERYINYNVSQSSDNLQYIKSAAWDVSSALRVAKSLTK